MKPSADSDDNQKTSEEKRRRGLTTLIEGRQGAAKSFNFTRFAGSQTIENQLRQVGAAIHVYGHQHRNRDRCIEGVRYISHCLGSTGEQQKGLITGMDEWKGPKQILPSPSQ